MRLVQYTMMPETPLSVMAEVLMSGLIVPHPDTPAGTEPEKVLFDFTANARQYLRDRTNRRDLGIIHNLVKGAVKEYIEQRAGVSVLDFEALLEDPQGLKDLPPDVKHFVQVEAETLRSLGYNRRQIPPPVPDRRLAALCASRTNILPAFIMTALGQDPSDSVLAAEGFLTLTSDGGIAITPNTHKRWHGRGTPDTHRCIAKAIEMNPAHEFSLRERLFHLKSAGMIEQAVSAAKDVGWLIAAAELGDLTLLEDLDSIGMSDLASELGVRHAPVRARLAASQDLEIARAAIRYSSASRYVNVVGTGAHELDSVSRTFASTIGRVLGETGLGLITGAWPGVDYVSAESYLRSGGKSLIHVVTLHSTDRFEGALQVNPREEDTAVKLSDAVVLVGGMGSTMTVFRAARRLGKPAYPYGPSGGDAAQALRMLDGTEMELLQSDLNPDEFAWMVADSVRGRKTSAALAKIWSLAATYDRTPKTKSAGPSRTVEMTKIFEQMRTVAVDAEENLADLQGSSSPGRRLGAIAILNVRPRRDQLDWLAERLDNPRLEKPFVGYQAAEALLKAVRALSEDDIGNLERALEKAQTLGAKLTTDPDRLQVLAQAELELTRKKTYRREEAELTTLVYRDLAQRGLQGTTITANILIFKTDAQRTWISFSTAGVVCVLDNRPRGEDYFMVQWFQRLDDIKPSSVTTQDRSDQSGLLGIGTRKNWLFSRQLFEKESLKVKVLLELRHAKDFRDRIHEYRLM
jgi:hypothetical protein